MLSGQEILCFLAAFLLILAKVSRSFTRFLIISLIINSKEFMDSNFAKYLLNKTKQDYNLIAEDFSRTRWNIWSEFGIFRDYIQDGDKVLDAGCGNGRLLELLKDKKIDYLGVDISDKLIELAKKKYPQNNFLIADTLNLPFPDNNFDKVFSVAVLHTIPSFEFREKALLELRRVLKPGGLLLLTVWDILRAKNLFLAFKQFLLKLIGKSKLDLGDAFVSWGTKTNRYYHFFTNRELNTLVSKVGFKVIGKGVARNENKKRSNVYIIAKKPS